MNRSERRAAERRVEKLARKAGIPTESQSTETARVPETIEAASSQNQTTVGLAHHRNGVFNLLSTEDPAVFEAFKQSLVDEHQPFAATESILVNSMAESHWLAQRAQTLQHTCTDPDTGAITDDKKFSLYMRYYGTHTRAFHQFLNQLLKLRSERRKSEIGFEAQKIANEKHEMKKAAHPWDLLKKDFEVHLQLGDHVLKSIQAKRENPEFEAQFAAELEKRGMPKREDGLPVSAAA